MSDFKESVKVSLDKMNKNSDIIRNLDKQEEIYNPNTEIMSKRTNVLRSGENVFLNVMLISGLLFSLNDSSKGIVDSSIIGRVKSPESIAKKESRKGRENKKSGDIVAYNIIIDRVHNSRDFYNMFRSDKIQSLYNERKSNIDLMQMVVDFINSFEMYGVSSELDETLTVEETREISGKRLENMKENCAKIAENIERYNLEDPINKNGIPINQSLRVMCEELLNKEIINAIKELNSEKYKLEKEIRNSKDEMSEEMLKIKKSNLKSLKVKLNLLESKKKWKINELIEILSGKIDKDKVMLYIPIIEHLKNKEMDELIEDGEGKEESNEKRYCELLTLVLYQLTKLEFVKDGQYEGLIYNNISTNLHNLLREYKNCEIDKGSYGNVTFESLQKLTTNLIRLNARLSDQLQFEIAKYEMDYYLKSIIKQFTGIENLDSEEKIKPNGYVSIHYDADSFEIKVTTHYRDRVASRGSAAYGSGRIDNKNEKKREIKRLSYQKYLLRPVSREGCPIIKMAKINNEYAEKIMMVKGNARDKAIYDANSINEFGLDKWRKELLKSTPRYFLAKYDGNSVRIEFFSALRNVEKYYSETSVIQIRDEVKQKIEDIAIEGEKRKSKGNKELLSDESYVIKISRNQYHEFVNHELKTLRNKIDAAIEQSENEDTKEYKGETK